MYQTIGPQLAMINIKKTRPKQEVIKIRKIHKITANEWQREYNEDNVSLNPNLEELVQSFKHRTETDSGQTGT